MSAGLWGAGLWGAGPLWGQGLGWPLLLAAGLIALYWLGRVAREAELGYRPGAAWWSLPGLAGLLLAPLLDVPALFGMGAALLLLAEYWPGAYRRWRGPPPPRRELALWGLTLVSGGLGGWAVLAQAAGVGLGAADLDTGRVALLLGWALVTLAGAAGLTSVLRLPRPRTRAGLTLGVRWKQTFSPEPPDLSVTLTGRGAQLRNVSSQVLQLAGWQPAGVNAWLRVRGEGGEVLNELRAGQVALLPVDERDSGVRVWYRAPAQPEQTALFRADWTPPARAAQRVLN